MTRTATILWALAWLVLIALVPRPARAKDGDAPYYPVHLDVHTEPLTEHQAKELVEEHHAVIERDLASMLEKHTIALVEDAAQDAVAFRVAFKWRHYDSSVYAVTLSAARPDGNTHELSFDLMGDHHRMLLEIEAKMPQLLGWFETPTEAPPAPTPDKGAPPPVHDTPPQPPPDKQKLRAIGRAGIGVLVAGVGVVVAGAVLHTQTKTTVQQSDEGLATQTVTERRFPVALSGTLLGLGSAAIAAGVSMIIADRVKAKKKRTSRVLVAPTGSARALGLTLSGRF